MKKNIVKYFKGILCMTLVLTLGLNMPFSHLQSVFAYETEVVEFVETMDISSDLIAEPTEEPLSDEVVIGEGLLEEYEEKREENVKHFYREDGLVEAVYYPYSVHYNKDGVWSDIDNSLVEKNIDGVTVYENTANSFKISFSKDKDTDSLVSLNNDGSKLSWAIPEMDYSNPVIETVAENTDDIRFQNKLFSKITYEDAINGVDVTYMLTPNGVKEYFIIENEEELESFNDITIVMKTDGLDVSKSDNKLHMKKNGADKFTLSEPVMFDSSSEFVSSVPFEVKEITGKGQRTDVIVQAKEIELSGQNDGLDTTTPVPSEIPSDVKLYSPIEKDTYNEFEEETPVSKNISTKIAEKKALRTEFVETVNPTEEIELTTVNPTEAVKVVETVPTVEATEETVEITVPENSITERSVGIAEETEVAELSLENSEEPLDLVIEETELVETEEPEHIETETPTETPEVSVAPTVSATEEAKEIEVADDTTLYINEVEELVGTDEGVNYFTYTIELDKESIKEAEITYPLIIDPDITADDSVSNMLDTFVSENYPTTNYGGIERLKIGHGALSGENRAYMKLASLPTLANGDMVVGAKLYMIRYWDENTEGFDYDNQINLHKVTESWDQSTMTWSTKKAYDSTVISADFSDYIDESSESESYINEFDITKLVKEWYNNPSANYGMMLKNADGADGYHEYRSADQWDEDVIHQVVDIIYVNSTGIESTYSYHELAIGRAGTAYINDATGNATLIHSDCASTDGKMPIQLSHVFDNNYRGINIGYGVGWRLNYDQTVEAVTIDEKSYYKYVDGDGTIHYYYKNGTVYYDEGNKQNKLTVSGTNVIIEDTSAHIKYTFVDGKLKTIADSNNNTLTISRNSSGYIDEITDPSGNKVTFVYSGDKLDTITCSDGEVMDFNYASSFLTEIVYSDGEICKYAYHEWCLDRIWDIGGYKIDLDYNSNTKLQVNKVTEYADEVAYNYLTFDYKTLLTTVTDNKGKTNHYRFNKYAQLINEQDYDGSAVYYDYETSVPGKKKNLNAASDILSTSINLIGNSSFEYNENYITSAWVLENTPADVSTPSTMDLRDEGYIGDKSLYLLKTNYCDTSKVYTTVTVTPGKTYTVSLYYKGTMAADLYAEYTNASGSAVTKEKEVIYSGDNWFKNTLTVTVPSDAGSTLEVGIAANEDIQVGVGIIDAVQVAENGTATRYNLIKNPDFTNGDSCWVKNSFESGDGCVTYTTGSEYKPDNLNDSVIKINGNINLGKSIHQNVGESGDANDSYIVGAFTKANGIPKFTHTPAFSSETITYGSFLLRVEFLNSGTLVNRVDKAFSYDTSDWQYLSFNAKATGTFTSIRVSVHFARNLNTAYFDGISLYKDGYGTAYTYDSSNNLEQIVTKEGKTYLYEYYDNNNLKKSTDEYGDVTEYTYDSKHNVKTVTTTPRGLSISKKTEYMYDSRGNVTQRKTYDSRNANKYYISNSTYYADKNLKETDTDARNNEVSYEYDSYGRLIGVTDDKDEIGYDYGTRNKLGMVATANTDGYVMYSYYKDNLSGIYLGNSHGFRFYYKFLYNKFGQLTDTYVNTQLLSTNEYFSDSKLLKKTTLGNGDVYKYYYNDKDQLTSMSDEYVTLASYYYSDEGYLSEKYDHLTFRTTYHDYDDESRLIRELGDPYTALGGTKASVTYTYDNRDRVSTAKKVVGDYNWTEEYGYDDTDSMLPTTFSTNKGVSSSTEYDDLGRLTKRTAGDSNFVVSNLTYENGTVTNSTTGLVKTFSAKGQSTETYTYDSTGLITKISPSTSVNMSRSYSYDAKSQLKKVVDLRTNIETQYVYDAGGNILSKTYFSNTGQTSALLSTVLYTYDTSWDDLLVSVGDETIEYDEIGNPTKYLEYDTLSWTGKNLDFIKIGNTAVGSYTYDSDGLRVSKTVSGVDTEYIYTNGQVSALNIDGDMLYFTYDGNGSLVSVTYDDEIYYYVINPQGDVVGLCDETGNPVATYTYDEWGYPISAPTSGIGALNPFRYRGYIFDSETEFYYLGSRYYDPEVGRFISADSTGVLTAIPMSLTDKNLFAYCDNNPIVRKDSSGTFWDYVVDVGLLVWSISDVIKEPKDWKNWASLAVDVVFAVVPFVPSGVGQVIKYGNRIDNAVDIAGGINKITNLNNVSKVTMIGRNMDRVTDTAKIMGIADNLYKTWKGYNKVASFSKTLANVISATHNGSWLFGKLRTGYTVIDIGMKSIHKGSGLWYGTERVVLGIWRARNVWKLALKYFLER